MSAQVNDAPTDVTPIEFVESAARSDARLLTITLVCLLPGVMAEFDFTVVYVAQPAFMAVFHTTQVMAAWTATGYALALAAAMAPSGWAINRFGARRLVVGSVLLFALGSVLCAIAASITLLIGARVVQGIGCGLLVPTTLTVLVRAAGSTRLGRVMSLSGIPLLMGAILGLVLGGWLIEALGWQWIFLINVPLGVLAALLAALTLPNHISGEDEPLDLIEVVLLCPGIAALLYGLAELSKYGTITASEVLVPAAAGTAMLTVFVWHALHRAQNPMINLGLLRKRVVLAANTARSLFAMSFLGASLILPLYFQQVLGASPMKAGMLFVPQAIGAAVSSPVVGRITDWRGPRAVVLVGTVLSAAGMGAFIWTISQPQVPTAVFMTALAVTGVGASASIIPVSSAAVHTLNDRDAAHGSTLLNVNHQVAAAIGIAGCSTLLTGLSESGVVYAYTIVLAISAGIGALALVPAAFLPTKAHP
ncbi:MAG: DHA2 family efflux MFS transporter permease subunit [Mycobacterium sp.]|nr:DHA2 family efflux MFS transporter permease subunit [Mycobacterium sp.]